MRFWSFWAKYCHFLHILSNARPKNNVNKVPRWVFRYVGNKTFDFSSKKKRIFCPKTTKFGPRLAFLVNLARPCRLFQCPVGGCGARAVSRKTPITLFYFISGFKFSYILLRIFLIPTHLCKATWQTTCHLNCLHNIFLQYIFL